MKVDYQKDCYASAHEFKVGGQTVVFVFDDGSVYLARNPDAFAGYCYEEDKDYKGSDWRRYNIKEPKKKPCDEKTKAEIKAKIDELQRLYEKL